MDRYRMARIIAKAISVIGWLMVAMCVVVIVSLAASGTLVMVGASVPVLGLLGGSLALVLFSWVARAVFDIASSNAGNGT